MTRISEIKRLLLCLVGLAGLQPSTEAAAPKDWVQSYKAGYTDRNGRYCGGSEIMHLVPHKGKLYAFTGLINGRWDPSKPVLVAPRTYAQSPFPSEKGAVYFGGFDANFHPSTETAWIFKANLDTVLSAN